MINVASTLMAACPLSNLAARKVGSVMAPIRSVSSRRALAIKNQ